jgi:hypothetical protein
VPINSSCILCDRESILHAFLLSSQNEQDNTETKEDLDLLPCSSGIVKYIQQISSSVPFQVLLTRDWTIHLYIKSLCHQEQCPKLFTDNLDKPLLGYYLLPEKFSRTSTSPIQPFLSLGLATYFVFDGSCDYDIIFG